MKKVKEFVVMFLCGTVFVNAQEVKPPVQLEMNGSIQMQMQKVVADNGVKDNLDDFWGRANVNTSIKIANYQSYVNIRCFPEGWGFEALSLNVVDSLVAAQQKTPIARFMIEQAWVKYVNPLVDIRLGRFFTSTSKTFHMGNFLDQNPGPGFQGKLSYHNGIEATGKIGKNYTVSALLGAGDKKLNTGYLRLMATAAFLEKNRLNLNIGYRVNIFDLAYNEDAIIQPRYIVGADFEIVKNLKPFIEVGFIDTSKVLDDGKYMVPFTAGTFIPAGKILNTVVAEVEFLGERKAKDLNKQVKDMPLHWALYIDKKLGAHTRFQAGIFSYPSGASAGDVMFGLRYTGALK